MKLTEGKTKRNIKSVSQQSRPTKPPPSPKPKQANESDLEWLKAMQVLDVKDDDIIVLKSSENLTKAQIEYLKEHVVTTLKDWGTNNKVVVLEGGLEFGILRKLSPKNEDKI